MSVCCCSAVVSTLYMMLFRVVQLRRMQEMIAKMQAQMQKQGDEGEAPHVWKAYSKRYIQLPFQFRLFAYIGKTLIYTIWTVIMSNTFLFCCRYLSHCLSLTRERERWMIAAKDVEALWLLTRTACHYLHSVPHGSWSHFFFFFFYTYSKVYSNSVMFIYIYTRFCFLHFFILFHFIKLLRVTQMK